MKYCLTFVLFFSMISCIPKSDHTVVATTTIAPAVRDSIMENIFKSEVLRREGLFSTEWQDELSKTLKIDPTNAYLWQQKSMPLYKQGKYQLGRPFLDKAAKFKPEEYKEYRAFMICIFEKNYPEAIAAFLDCIDNYGDSYVMDHSYSFYIAISKIQLNEFEEAESLLRTEIERQRVKFGASNVHFLDLFYLGISLLEQNKYEAAISAFDESLAFYSNFADAQMYKSSALVKLGRMSAADSLSLMAEKNGKEGHTINEDNASYERYPYQIRWKN